MTLFLIEMDTCLPMIGTTNRNGRKEYLVTEEQLEEMTAEFEAFDGIIIDVFEKREDYHGLRRIRVS